MTDPFANLVNPIFEYMIKFQDRLGQDDSPDFNETIDGIQKLLDEAERGSQNDSSLSRDYKLAKPGLVYWIDEVMSTSLWEHASAANQKSFQFKYWGHRDGGNRFFPEAEKAAQGTRIDPIETYFLCMALGFRGSKFSSLRSDGVEPEFGGFDDAESERRGGQSNNAEADFRKLAQKYYERIQNATEDDSPNRGVDEEVPVLEPLPGQTMLLRATILASATIFVSIFAMILLNELRLQ